MYYGIDAFRMYIKMYNPPYDETDIGIIDGFFEGDISLDEEGKLHLTKFVDCQGES